MVGTAVLLVTSAPGASAAVTLDQSFTTGSAPSTLAVPANTIYLRAQTFTAGLTGSLTKVSLPWVKARGATGNLTVEIRATSSDTPTTTVLATETIPNASLPSTLASYDVTFSSPVSVTAGTTYAIVMGASANAVDVGYSNTGGYAGGRETYSTDGSTGAAWTSGTARDLYFQTYVDVVATAPAAPTGVTLTPGDTQLGVACTLGSDGGSAVTDVEYRLDGGSWTSTGGTVCSFTITGLTNATTYAVEVRAVNSVNGGAASTAVNGTPVAPASSDKAITAYGFASPAATGVIDTVAHTISVDVPAGTDATALVASFTLSAGASAEVSSVAQTSGTTANDFTSPVTYTVTAADTSTQAWVVTVTVTAASAESEPPPPATYRFTFNTSTGGECFTWTVTAGPVTLPDSTVACTPEGTELVGWSVPGQSANFSDAGTVTASGDQTFTAVARNRQIRITYDANVGDGTICRVADLDTAERWLAVDTARTELLAKASPCTPDGYVLVGWTDQPTTGGPTTAVAGALMRAVGDALPARWNADPNPINDIHLYAVWALATQ